MEERRRQQYEGLVRSHAADLYRFAFRLTGARAVAEDLVQETLSEAWRCVDQLRAQAAARPWLFQILRHRHAHLRRGASRRPSVEIGVDALAGEGSDSVACSSLQHALDLLDDRFKVPFLMVFLEGLTCQEAADALDLPLGTVLSRIHRARIALRAAIDAEPRARVVPIDAARTQGRRP